MQLRKQVILIISPEPWGEHLLSKHHYALALEARGNDIYFLGPPNRSSHKGNPPLHVLDSYFSFPGVNRYPERIRKFCMGLQIRSLIRKIGRVPDVVWSFDPYRFQDLNLFNAKVTIYHSVDIHKTSWDQYVASKADLILTTSETLKARYDLLDKPAHTIGHGVAPVFFEKHKAELKLRPNRTAIGYSGNLLIKYLDLDTFTEIIRRHQQVDFYFFGSYEPSNLSPIVPAANARFIQFLKEQEHCFLLGPKRAEKLAAGLQCMDALLICYDSDKYLNEVANPHKTMEYLALGKVIITTKLLHYKSNGELMLMSAHNRELPALFNRALLELDQLNHLDKINERQNFAAEHVYESKIAQIESLL